MSLNYKEAIRPISYVADNPGAAIEYITEHRSPIIITQNDEAKAVLLDIDTYQRTENALALLQCIKIGEQAAAEGRVHSAKDVFEEIERKLAEYV